MNAQCFLNPVTAYRFNPVVVTFGCKEVALSHKDKIRRVAETFFNSPYHNRKDITTFADYIQSLPENLGENPYPLFHVFADGVYSREIHIPAGHIIVGKIHRFESMVYVMKGKLLVADEFGIKMVTAPAQFVSKAGVQRIAYILEDTVWMDVHHTDKTTVTEAEKALFFNSHKDLNLVGNIGDLLCQQQ
jgi:hypothetical protein